MTILIKDCLNTTDKKVIISGMAESVTPASLHMTSTKRHQTPPNSYVDLAYVITLHDLCNDTKQPEVFTAKLRQIKVWKLQFMFN